MMLLAHFTGSRVSWGARGHMVDDPPASDGARPQAVDDGSGEGPTQVLYGADGPPRLVTRSAVLRVVAGESVGATYVIGVGGSDCDGDGTPNTCEQDEHVTIGDLDVNGRVDLRDAAHFQRCFTGADGSLAPCCEPADLNSDASIDLNDLSPFTSLLTGP